MRDENVIYEGVPSNRSMVARCILNPVVVIGGVMTSGLGFGIGAIWAYMYKHTHHAKVTPRSVSLRKGLTSSERINVPMYKIKSVSSKASLIERLMGTGHVTLTDTEDKKYQIYGVDDYEGLYAEISHHVDEFKMTNSNVRLITQ